MWRGDLITKEDRRQVSRAYVDLKEHFEKLWDERKENITIQFNAIIDRLNATATVLEHRLEVLNHAYEQSLEDRADFAKKRPIMSDWQMKFQSSD